ncbi:MAG: response regulator transcription factor [Tepidisphaeraceae bacterium]|jgi:DNA-binding NarL/FixJ family response regulator
MAKTPSKPDSKRYRIFLVEDHPVMRQGLGRLIDDQPDMKMCGDAESPPDAMRLLAGAKADMVIVDLTLRGGDGLELCKQIRDRWKDLPVLVVSMHDESLYAERALKAGARGYVMKQEPQEAVMNAIRTVLKGQIHVSNAMSAKLLQSFSGNRSSADLPPLARLTDRELEIFRLIGEGQSVRAIAEKLFLSTKTVEAHKEHIKQKLNLKSSNELLKYAIEARLTDRG